MYENITDVTQSLEDLNIEVPFLTYQTGKDKAS